MNEYERLRKRNWVGFAEVYLDQCNKDSGIENKADIQVYRKLVQLDSRLGTTATEQLFRFLWYTLRLDILKVWISVIDFEIKVVLGDKYKQSWLRLC